MGQKVNPHGLRVGVIKDWDSRWYAREDKVGDLIVEDYNIRKYLKSTLYSAGIAKIEIERDNAKVKISIHCSRPGVIIGKGGTEIEKLRLTCEKMLEKPTSLNIVEVKNPDADAQLVAENIAQQVSDNDLLLYAYLKEKNKLETETEISGSEKEERMEELDSKIERLLEGDEDETEEETTEETTGATGEDTITENNQEGENGTTNE